MKFCVSRRQITLLALPILLATLSGCTTLYTNVSPPASPISPVANWQIQTGSLITAAPTGQVFLSGPMQIQGSQVTATFETKSLCSTPQLESYAGTYDSATGALTLAAAITPFSLNVQLAVPPKPTNLSVGIIDVTGQTCTLALSSPAVGVEIPALTGTFTGTLTSPAGLTGQATLTVTQSATPNSSAQFPVSGTLSFTTGGGSCGTYGPVTGTISGAAFTLSESAAAPITLTGASTAGGATLPATTVTFPSGPLCNAPAAAYSGTLKLK